jgi:hypothetical protein
MVQWKRLFDGSENYMRFYRNLYTGPKLQKNKAKVMWKLKTGRPQPLVYVIALARNNDLFEIYHSAVLKQKYFRKKENAPYILGIASGYDEALDLITQMLMEVYAATGGYDVKTYYN